MLRTLAALFVFVFPLSVFASDLVFKMHGKEVEKIPLEELKRKVPVKDVEVLDPILGAKAHYLAFEFKALLSLVYKNQWRSAEEVLFTCSDGYQPSIPMQQFQKHTAYFATAKPGGLKFNVIHKNDGSNKDIDLAPGYLVWKDDPEVRADGETDWPYQVVSIDLVSFAERYPRLSPPKGASPHVQRGFLEFKKFCLVCHTINGEGGAKAPELNYPANVTEYFKEQWFYKFVNNPQSVRISSTMSPFSLQIENSRLHLKDVFAYLKSMRQKKLKPQKK